MVQKIQLNQQNLMSLSAKQLAGALESLPPAQKKQLFNDTSLMKLLVLIMGKVQYVKKNEELEVLEKQLKKINDDTGTLNHGADIARADAANDRGYGWSQDVKDTVANANKGKTVFSDKASDALQEINSAVKSLGNKSKEISTKANESRQNLNAMMQTASGILKSMQDARKGTISRL